MRPLSPALVIAVIALFMGLGGGAAAYASGLISGKKIVNHSIPEKKLTAAAIRALRGQRGPQGPKGPVGPTGPQGATGASGPSGTNGATNVVVRTTTQPVAAGGGAFLHAACNTGERATGGGVTFSVMNPETMMDGSYPTLSDGSLPSAGQTPVGWSSQVTNNNPAAISATLFVICASP